MAKRKAERDEETRDTPIRHESLSKEDLAICAYTCKRVGKYIQPTLERWELGFMKDTHPLQELAFWVRACLVLERIQPKDPGAFVRKLCIASIGSGTWPADALEEADALTDSEIEDAIAAAFKEAGLAPPEERDTPRDDN
jgi:hypothetical protein